MKPLHSILVIFLFAILATSGCNKDNPVGPKETRLTLTGQVNDPGGNPVEGCGVHYVFSMTSSPLGKTEQTCPSTSIQYSVPVRGMVTLTILRWYTRDVIATPVNDTLDAGYYTVTVDASGWTNGVYVYQLTINGTATEKSMLLLNTDVSALARTTPLVSTDARGQFSLPYGMLGFGIPFTRTSASGPTLDTVYVSHTVQIVLAKSGYTTSVTTLTLDRPEGMRQAFTLEAQ